MPEDGMVARHWTTHKILYTLCLAVLAVPDRYAHAEKN